MNQSSSDPEPRVVARHRFFDALEVLCLWLLMFVHGGELAPGINEAHYLVKAKGFWEPQWCPADLFAHSGKAHMVFDFTFGYLTHLFSLDTAAWIGRAIGWWMLSIGLLMLTRRITSVRWLSVIVALGWMVGVDGFNLAGEWVVGGIEAKVPAYAFVLMGLSAWLSDKPERAWAWLGLAAAFHVLVGGWSVAALFFAACFDRQTKNRWREHAPWLVFGGVLSLMGLIPALQLNAGVSAEVQQDAANIYTYQRISHHLLFTAFETHWMLRYLAVVALSVIAVILGWSETNVRRLSYFGIGTLLLAMVGISLSYLAPTAPDLAARLLRFYWFRLSDAMISLIGMLALIAWLQVSSCHPDIKHFKAKTLSSISVACIVLICVIWEYRRWQERMAVIAPGACRQALLGLRVEANRETKQQVLADWLNVCFWIKENTDEQDVFLSPRYQQTFKWYAQRAEVVNWKDVPQDAATLREWSRRMSEIFPARLGGSRVTVRYDELRRYRETYGAKYLINDRRIIPGNLPLVRIYPPERDDQATFEVYEIIHQP